MAQIPALRPRKIVPDASIQIQWLQDDGERASSHSHANKRNPVTKEPTNLEIPLWTVQKENDKENCFQLPTHYIEYKDEYNIIEYELDEKDELFLNRIQKKTDIDEDLLESAIDYFEKESFLAKEYSLFVPAKDESDLSICCVCRKLELQDDHHEPLLMTCQGCCIISHPCCQGLEEEPENWFCERCLHEQIRQPNQSKTRFKERFMRLRKEKKCVCCQKADGSMLQRNNEWVHTVCVAWLPGFSFNPDESNIRPCQFKAKCTVCKGTESLIHCSESYCKIHYHGSCAQELGYYFEMNPDGMPLSYCSSHSSKKKSKNFQTLLPVGQGRVDIGQFLTESTKTELEKLINKNISEETFKTLWDYWRNKRQESDYGRAPLIPRLKIEKDLLQALSMKDVEAKLNEAKKRWESLKTKLLPENKPIAMKTALPLIARAPIIREKNNFKKPDSVRVPPAHQLPNNNKNRNQPLKSPIQLNNDYSDEIEDVETNIEESDYESDVIQYVDDEESNKSDEVEILQENIVARTPQNNDSSKRISKPSKYLNEKDYTFCARNSRKSLESQRSTTKKKPNNNKIATTINLKNNNHLKSKTIQIIEQDEEQEDEEQEDEEQEDEEQEDQEQEDQEQEDEEQEGEEQEADETSEKETRPVRTGKKRTFESATLFPTPGSVLYKRVKTDDRNNKINSNYNTLYHTNYNTNNINTYKNNKKSHYNNNNTNNINNNNKNNNNNNNSDSNGKKLLFKLDQASQIDVMKVDKKAIMQEQATKTRPPTRGSPGKIASGIPTYYGSGADRIAWTPNVQFSHNGDKKDSSFLFGAGFPSPLSPSERPAKRTW
jgi:hypothetical protein